VRWELTTTPAKKAPSTVEEEFASYLLKISDSENPGNSTQNRDRLSIWAERYMDSHQYEKAQAILIRLYKIACQVDGPDSIIAANAAMDLANCYYLQGKYKEAQRYYAADLSISSPVLGAGSELLTAAQSRLGQICFLRGDLAHAHQYLALALTTWKRNLKQDTPEYAITLSTMAQVLERNGDARDAITLYNDAAKVWLGFSGVERRNAIKCYNAAGNLHMGQSEYDQAHRQFSAAAHIARQEYGADSLELAHAMSNDANALLKEGDMLNGLAEKIQSRLIFWSSAHNS
jgi:tetratricopeptide (TPR) repeat protein